ncbi:MAG TPA: hypothetical protein VGX25_22450 [Actinophytocola sp.]|uniref:hypothetical protein n=1 Tax=Actinophytocola sp. TaxID=1872138 RepID=UPI002DDD4EBA|nr:hypothetical protein [Actinophytocola sp.]HEV2782163.1 hypothetical protein [Actinophytocola sp.]
MGDQSPKKSIDWVVGLSLITVALVSSGIAYALAKVAQNPQINKPGTKGYIEFATLYGQTLLLSLTMTLAIVVVTIPRIYGRWNNPGWALLVVAAGSYTTGRSHNGPDTTVHNMSGTTASLVVGGYSKAMRLFAVEYGPAFYGGVVVGIAGGVIITILIKHHRAARIPAPAPGPTENSGVRPIKPWIPVTILVTTLIGIFAYLASLPW